MKAILNEMRTDETLIKWRAAASILFYYENSVSDAMVAIDQHIGHGITEAEADELRHHVIVLAREKNR